MPQLDFSWFIPQVFWLLSVFLVVFLVVNYLFIPRMTAIFIKRQKLISDDIYEASLLVEACKKEQAQIEIILNDARNKAALILKIAHEEADALLVDEIKKADAFIKKFETKELGKLERYQAKLQAGIDSVVTEVSGEIVNKLAIG